MERFEWSWTNCQVSAACPSARHRPRSSGLGALSRCRRAIATRASRRRWSSVLNSIHTVCALRDVASARFALAA
jgi:hypothetical protein